MVPFEQEQLFACGVYLPVEPDARRHHNNDEQQEQSQYDVEQHLVLLVEVEVELVVDQQCHGRDRLS